MSYLDRTAKTIEMISPGGNIFNPKWRGNEREKSKKLGIFDYPKVKKQIVQDLEINSTSYPLTVFFDGPDSDLLARDFFSACDERGKWTVIHPVVGSLLLQLVSVSDNIDFINNNGLRIINLQFLDTADESTIVSVSESRGQIEDGINNSNASSSDGFKNKIKSTTAAGKSAINIATNKISDAVSVVLGPISELNSEVFSLTNSIQRGIQDTLSAAVLKPLSLAAQIQQLIQTPALIQTDIKTRLDAYSDLANEIFGITPDDSGEQGLNTSSIKEVAAVAILGAVASVSANSDLNSRTEAINSINQISNLFDDITNNLDADQDVFLSSDIDLQYFSQSDSYNDNTILTAKSLKVIFDQIVDLRIAKTFVIDRPRAPIDIVISEYGDLGDGDSNLDFFISTNNLSGSEIRLLPAGSSVLVYV